MTATLAFERLRIDDDVTNWMVEGRSQPWIGVAHVVTFFGNSLTMTVICTVVVVWLMIRRHVDEAVLLTVGSLVGAAVMVTFKHVVARSRPPVTDRLLHIESYSFPSGHAMMSMVVFCLLAVVAYRLSPWVRGHRWVLLAAPALSFAIGVTRVYLGVHWTTDVLAGWACGALWVLLCVWASTRVTVRRNGPIG
ncbi:phosphatase PAP2 family protein [Gordonia sp. L191]|uniref:phosphatase PAP2 family protein n=1 Tax=Gordonia sp. L191 TaxID=2982699 RepID=UPI0024BFACB3|nr:phosphatase PAP2 family protein [Gordonia sp. L191]WHU47995.1 phosphatase PAP2 family protein [Gordonia sp. L191]